MIKRNDISRRIGALEQIIRPFKSLAARLAKLSDTDRARYDAWQDELKARHVQFTEPSGAYAAYLDGNEGPKLPRQIAYQLFDPAPVFTAKMNLDQITNAWAEYKGRGL